MGGMGPRPPAQILRERKEEIAALQLAEFERRTLELFASKGIDVEGARVVLDRHGAAPGDDDGMVVNVEWHLEWPDGRRYPDPAS